MQEMLLINNRKLLLLKGLFIFLLSMSLMQPVAAQSVGDLWIDVRNDRAGEVSALLSKGLDPNTRNERGNPIIMQAVRDNAWRVFEVVLNNRETDINITNAHQETPLMYVSLVGNLEMAKKLVAKGAQVNHLGWTPLHYAAAKGQVPVVEFLLSQGALPNAPAPDGTSPIAMAAQAGAIDTVQVLLAAGADPTAVNTNGVDAIQAARDKGHTRLAAALEEVVAKRRAQNR